MSCRDDKLAGVLPAHPTDWPGLLEAVEGLDTLDDFLRVLEDLPPASPFATGDGTKI